MHAIHGRCVALEAARNDGPLNVRGIFCACDPCEQFDFSPGACRMHTEYGTYKLEYAKRAVPRDPRVTRSQELEKFALSLRKDQVHALVAVHADRHIEGNIWFCLLLSDAYVAPDDITHSTDGIEAGWWVVNAVYYYLAQRSPRGYLLDTQKVKVMRNGREVEVVQYAERVLVVNHLIRLPAPGVTFAPLPTQRRTPRKTDGRAGGSISAKAMESLEASL